MKARTGTDAEQSERPDAGTASVTRRVAIGRQRDRVKTREELKSAMLRIVSEGEKLTISAVAARAGVTPGLIHNTYPDVAEEIRARAGRGIRQQRDKNLTALRDAKMRMRELRNERDAALADLAKLASVNETLRQEVSALRAEMQRKVIPLPPVGRKDVG